MKSIYPYILLQRSESHKQEYELGSGIVIQLETRFQENARTRSPELATVVGTFDEDQFPTGSTWYCRYTAWTRYTELYIPETQQTLYKVPMQEIMFEVRGNDLLPLKGYCLGVKVTNPDRFHEMAPAAYKDKPLKDIAQIIAVHPDITEVSVGDYVKTNKHGCGYTLEVGKQSYIKVLLDDIECIVGDYKQIK